MILKIKGKRVEYFSKFSLTLRYDSVASAFSFTFAFNPDNQDHRDLFKPLTYPQVTLEHNDELLITGTILSHTFQRTAKAQLAAFAGYSTPGVLEDCDIPTSIYPLQSDGLSLRQIATKLLKPFGIKMSVDPLVSAKMDQVFTKSTAGDSQSIKSYLTELAAQKNIVISHNGKGELLFTIANTDGKPLIDYQDGAPFTSITLSTNGQAMHSDITVQKQADPDSNNASEGTIKNPFVVTAFRPKVVRQTSGTDNNVSDADKNALAEELKNIKLTIVTDRWEVDGKILKPNNLISVQSPENYLFKRTIFFIESITFDGDNVSTIATLNCVLPEVYNGKTPKNIFD